MATTYLPPARRTGTARPYKVITTRPGFGVQCRATFESAKALAERTPGNVFIIFSSGSGAGINKAWAVRKVNGKRVTAPITPAHVGTVMGVRA